LHGTPTTSAERLLVNSRVPAANSQDPNFSLVALTVGSEGCAIQGKDQNQFLQLAAPKEAVVDSTGAGDAFAAAFLKSYLEAKDLEAAGKAGLSLGAIAVTLPGGRPKG
jgi:sugar/nucleoside kinase (ribokinase family)